jgi:4-carboxymuconolactone decarboxylase
MKTVITTVAMLSLAGSVLAQEAKPAFPRMAPPIVRETVTPLADYTDEVLFGSVWARMEITPRQRSLVTLSALLVGGHTAQMTGHLNRALDNGVTPVEITEVITHLAFYAGWPNAMSAVPVAKAVFEKRGIDSAQLTAATMAPLPTTGDSETARLAGVDADIRPLTPALADYTDKTVFADLWLRPQLAARDRSLITVAALIAGNQGEQLPFYLAKAMDEGMTKTELSEVVTHLAFYSGWPKAMSAVPILKQVFDTRGPT